MQTKVILAIDQGTTGSRALLYAQTGKIVGQAYEEFPQFFPHPGWVEHDPQLILHSIFRVIKKSLSFAGLHPKCIEAIGITNQRETTVMWDKDTGNPVYPAIVWQDRRTSDYLDRIKKKKGYAAFIHKKTGLFLDPYFSASKINWILKNVKEAKKCLKKRKLLFGTIDSWILWNLTGGVHRTDMTNASRTLLYDIHRHEWDPKLLKLFHIPRSILPEVCSPGAAFGKTVKTSGLPADIPIYAMMGDQQSALYGQGCYDAGAAKNTYGTGAFVVIHSGKKLRQFPKGLLATIASDREGQAAYAIEGPIFIAGAAIQWLRDGLHLFCDASMSEELAKRVRDNGGVTFIPAFSGIAAPWWNDRVRGRISGLTRGTKVEHIVRAALESIAHQTCDVLEVFRKKERMSLKKLRVDGGATKNTWLMQFQADMLGMPIHVTDRTESTAWGVAKLAGLKANFWRSFRNIDQRTKYRIFKPRMGTAKRKILRNQWKTAMAELIRIVN